MSPLVRGYSTSAGHEALRSHPAIENQVNMEKESVDVKALAAMFNSTLYPGGGERASQRSPRPQHVADPPIPSQQRPQRHNTAAKFAPRPPQTPLNPRGRASSQILHSNTSDKRSRGHQGGQYNAQTLDQARFSRTPPLQDKPRQRSSGDVAPLRKPLPPYRPAPPKPKRPPNVNLEPFRRILPRDPGRRTSNEQIETASGLTSPPAPPRNIKPRRQTVSLDDGRNPGVLNGNMSVRRIESQSDNNSPFIDNDESQIYEFDEIEEEMELIDHQRKEAEIRKMFQLDEELEVLYTTTARHDWFDNGQLSLCVQQGETLEILRVTNTPRGTWLARSMSGNYGYIASTCVDIDYDSLKFKMMSGRRKSLPPPPPDPPQMAHSPARDGSFDASDDYDDVEPISGDLPPPPIDICIEPTTERDLRKRFKFTGPIEVLQTMMVNPNGTVKKPAGKELAVTQGEVVDVIQQTNKKKVLCYNRMTGKCGYVSRNLLLPMKGGVYDDVDRQVDVYDNELLSPRH